MEGWKTLMLSLAGLLATVGGQFGIPILSDIAVWLNSNTTIVLPAIFAIYGLLRMVSKGVSGISLVK